MALVRTKPPVAHDREKILAWRASLAFAIIPASFIGRRRKKKLHSRFRNDSRMHVSFHQRWDRLLIAALTVAWATSATIAQEVRDGNFRRTYDGRPTINVPDNSYASQPAPSAPKVFRSFFANATIHPTTVVRGNGSSNAAGLAACSSERSAIAKIDGDRIAPSVKGSITTILSSLAMVLGVFFLVAWFARPANPKATTVLPKEVVETLGRTSMGNRQYLQLVRLGNKLLLLSVSPHSTETLTEVTTAEEVERLTALCQQHQPGSVTTTFRSILAQLGNEPTAPGFLGADDADELELANTAHGRRPRLRVREEDHD